MQWTSWELFRHILVNTLLQEGVVPFGELAFVVTFAFILTMSTTGLPRINFLGTNYKLCVCVGMRACSQSENLVNNTENRSTSTFTELSICIQLPFCLQTLWALE